jgi:hypothetical protein
VPSNAQSDQATSRDNSATTTAQDSQDKYSGCEYQNCERDWSHLVYYHNLNRAHRYCDPHAREETGKHNDASLYQEVDRRE